MKGFCILLTSVMLLFASVFFVTAHPGKTDANGGHADKSTGEYHYHHGYPAHQHTNGVCPYESSEAQTTAQSVKAEATETVGAYVNQDKYNDLNDELEKSRDELEECKDELEECKDEKELISSRLSDTQDELEQAKKEILELEEKNKKFGIIPLIAAIVCAATAGGAILLGSASNKKLKNENTILRDKINSFKL